jgi:uncharacterized protein (TIGR02611 family)
VAIQNGRGFMLRHVRRVAVAFVGGTVVLVGLAMTVLPGPAILVIPAGLAILATEFAWARRLLDRVRTRIERTVDRVKRPRPDGPRAEAGPPR